MVFKLNISLGEKTYKLETSSNAFIGKKIGEKIEGKFIKEVPDLADYEFQITGASDNAGFPCLPNVFGTGRKRVLLTRGKGMRIKKPKGLRLRRTVHGNIIDDLVVQINLKVTKQGKKPLEEIFKKEEENRTS
ncbi:MAG: eS6 family ribosomal protein [Candidatus Pacearchaeota archaeon]|nr:eS6 family ribosomal protein [Candidatus Pacearchaeota archaeon]